ncbi:MAG TPA: uracil-DNA glycosylase [Anaerolineales bacterium]|nr:uracil-DNA glycosylase [Anaerolineales bacterium]
MSRLSDLNQQIPQCELCPRLRVYCRQVAQERKKQFAQDEYWGKPVPGWGDENARILIVGLAPAAHGSNRTGRMLTGDGTDGMGTSDFLAASLYRNGLANQPTSRQAGDGYQLNGVYYSAIARCAPPENKPTPAEIQACGAYLQTELSALPNLRVIVALGKLAFDQVWRLLPAQTLPRPVFAHGARVQADGQPVLLGTYHPSRQNTQTGKLSPSMLDQIFQLALQF